MAGHARDSGDPRTAVVLLRSARAGTRGTLTATEQAVLAGELARAYGRLDNQAAAQAAADEAYLQISRSQPEEDPPYIYWAGFHSTAVAAGESLLYSGDPHSAIPHLRSAVEHLGEKYPRELVLYRTDLGIANAKADDVEAAIHLGHQTIDAAPLTSARARTYVVKLCREIEATGHPDSGELTDHARTILGDANA
jgi:hypothetical protein